MWACGVSLYILVAGAFPFLRLEEERRNDIERMQLMFPRILAGDFLPLPSEVRDTKNRTFAGFGIDRMQWTPPHSTTGPASGARSKCSS